MRLFAEKRLTFSDPRHTLSEGVVDVNDDVSVERLLEAYSFGIFPWPQEGLPTLWFCPEQRGVLDLAEFHVPRSLAKALRAATAVSRFSYTWDRAFDQVIDACVAAPRPGQDGTWITDRLVDAYRDFHRAGYAHSLEVWEGDSLVGGLYGVYVAGVFSGESMFFRVDNASKLALIKLVEFLRAQGLKWLDIQMVTPLLEGFGGKYVSRAVFLRRLEEAKKVARALPFDAGF